MKKNINIDGIEYAPVSTEGGGQELVCVDNRGLLFVGFVDFSGNDEFVTIKNARCVIRWGTTRHVAELCGGPLEGTKLGEKHDVVVRRDNVQYRYPAEGDWAK